MSYCSLSDVKAYLSIDNANTDDDALLTSLIARAQAVIETYTGHVFEASTATTKYFDAVADVHKRFLYFNNLVCVDITSVVNGDGVTIASNKYTTEPRNDSPYYGIALLGSSGFSWTYTDDPENAIAITAKWAWSASPPNDIVHACIRVASWLYYQKDNAIDIDKPLLVSSGMLLPPGFPADIREMLEAYRRLI